MWINRETSRKASRWSRLLLSALYLGAALSSVHGAPQPDVAILETGPSIGHGLPYLAANVMKYYAVTYKAATRSEAAVTAFYTASAIPPSPAWQPVNCGGYRLLSISTDPLVLLFSQGNAWSALLVFPKGFANPCQFAGVFIGRFIYFLGITQDAPLSSFPAILQLAQ